MHSRWLGIPSFAAVVAMALSGCGGGGGTVPTGDSNGESEISIVDNWQRFEAGNPTLRMSSAQIRQAYDSRSRSASHELTWYLGSVVGGVESIVAEVDPYEHEDLSELPPGSTVSFAPVLEHNGVRVAETKARVIFEEDGQTYLADSVIYGGWLDHTDFGVGFLATCDVDEPGCSGTNPVYAWGLADGIAPFGVYPGTTPTGMGSATWTGVMVGMESPMFDNEGAARAWANAGRPDVYLGDARIRIDDLAAPNVDVFLHQHPQRDRGNPAS